MSKRFQLQHNGEVVEGIHFSTGRCAVAWKHHVGVYGSVEDVLNAHGHGSETRVIWLDSDPITSTIPPPANPDAKCIVCGNLPGPDCPLVCGKKKV